MQCSSSVSRCVSLIPRGRQSTNLVSNLPLSTQLTVSLPYSWRKDWSVRHRVCAGMLVAAPRIASGWPWAVISPNAHAILSCECQVCKLAPTCKMKFNDHSSVRSCNGYITKNYGPPFFYFQSTDPSPDTYQDRQKKTNPEGGVTTMPKYGSAYRKLLLVASGYLD